MRRYMTSSAGPWSYGRVKWSYETYLILADSSDQGAWNARVPKALVTSMVYEMNIKDKCVARCYPFWVRAD